MAGEGEHSVQAQALRCENCGAPWEMRGFAHVKTVACENCGSVFDNTGEQWELVQKVTGAYETRPRYKLGTRGKLDGIEWEVIGWVERSVTVWGTRYPWEEHLLFNPYEGFRYLMFQDGHWAVVTPLAGVPAVSMNEAVYEDRKYKHFSTAEAVVDEVLGEFPWEVRRDDTAAATDFVDPPFIISSEESKGEVNWSGGRYLPRDEVLDAFGPPSRPLGGLHSVHPCQPNPHSKMATWMKRALGVGVLLWLILSVFYVGTRQNKVIWQGKVGKEGISIPEVKLNSFKSNTTVEFSGKAACRNNWVFLNCVLVNPNTEKASHAGLEISYYAGSGWSEGSRKKEKTITGVPNGTYMLQIYHDAKSTYQGEVDVKVKRDVPLKRYPCITFLLLFIVPLLVLAQSRSFERSRWAESDHPFG